MDAGSWRERGTWPRGSEILENWDSEKLKVWDPVILLSANWARGDLQNFQKQSDGKLDRMMESIDQRANEFFVQPFQTDVFMLPLDEPVKRTTGLDMKYAVYASIFAISLAIGSARADNTPLAGLQWMVGAWRGNLGERTVEEAWSEPTGGHMSAMVRLSGAAGIETVELIAIEESAGGLTLYLRQFSPALEPRVSQDMSLDRVAEYSVSFVAGQDAVIPRLTYTLIGEDAMRIDVTRADGAVLSAYLERH